MDAENAYLAGLYEGEGTVTVHKSKHHGLPGISVRISMTDLDVLNRAKDLVGGGSVNGPYESSGNRKPHWTFGLYGRDKAERFFERVRPWLGERRTKRFLEVLALHDEAKAEGRGSHKDWAGKMSEAQRLRFSRRTCRCGARMDERTKGCHSCQTRHWARNRSRKRRET